MKRKIPVTILSLIMGLSIAACGKQETTTGNESITATVESTQAETTETSEANTETTESVETTENTEEVEETIEATDITKGEPLSEKDLAFSFLGYNTYNEYVEAGNDGGAYIVADNAAMILSGEFTDDGDVLESTVRGIKLGDSIDKVFELYGNTEEHSADIKNEFSHDGLKDSGAYNYFLKLDSTKEYFYAFRFRVDQNNNIIAVVIEPIPMEYWS
ncbi:hypothetical protein [Roseburia inulinivorans]|nr:hypothetical protein [bacterium]MDY3040246.1 hypothetical protein [Roseburia inulinivorans]